MIAGPDESTGRHWGASRPQSNVMELELVLPKPAARRPCRPSPGARSTSGGKNWISVSVVVPRWRRPPIEQRFGQAGCFWRAIQVHTLEFPQSPNDSVCFQTISFPPRSGEKLWKSGPRMVGRPGTKPPPEGVLFGRRATPSLHTGVMPGPGPS